MSYSREQSFILNLALLLFFLLPIKPKLLLHGLEQRGHIVAILVRQQLLQGPYLGSFLPKAHQQLVEFRLLRSQFFLHVV